MAAIDHVLIVDGHEIPNPDTYSWGEQDVSAPDAGRNRDEATIASIISALSPEYISVRYFDARAAGYITKTFYVGDRSVPFREIRQGGHAISTLTFNIIER